MSNLRSENETRTGREVSTGDPSAKSTAAPLVLSLDTATGVRSVAVAEGARVLAQTAGRVQKENTSSVLADVDGALRESGVRLDEIELYAVTTGPGSFTGLRSGLATVKALASTLDRPVVGVPTLHAIAFASGASSRVVASLPAGRGEVFAQLLSVGATGEVEELREASHLTPSALLEKASGWGGNLTWAGAGAHVHAAAIRDFARLKGIVWREENGGEDVPNLEETTHWTLARPVEAYAAHVAALGLTDYLEGNFISAEELRAFYVRLSDAELNERCRGQN
ncbi:MAG TPA: tRNA (adenosine(37)-N6)-threonylcarbamoyltransferase complex dimerization subunit type 1 TsaB [Pyrinomonadaceae bacterium]|nr:tRNA (adenosine(37)-N6)-threonylcarbamoyltransferase complex dimerization subunit type 1 TsaB [Pyrinomonadaceae bacterium]